MNLFGGGDAPPPVDRRGVVVVATGAWLFHRSQFEVGPALDVDITTWGGVTVTANVALGFVAP